MRKAILAAASSAALIVAGAATALAQHSPAVSADPNFVPESVGRGWPVMPQTYPYNIAPNNQGNVVPPGSTSFNPNAASLELNPGVSNCAAEGATAPCMGQGAVGGAPPPGVTPLDRDIFTSPDYYLDRELWDDPRYFRCNSPYAVESTFAMTGGNGTVRVQGGAATETARWGDCTADLPLEASFSPYPFGSAQDHYEALLAEATERGTLAHYSHDNPPPDWTGRYNRQSIFPQTQFMDVLARQSSTHLQFFTEEYKYYAMQELYHHGNTNAAMWPSQFCWPEGFMRLFSLFAVRDHHIFMTPQMMILQAGVADNFQMQFNFDRTFNMTGVADGDVPFLGNNRPPRHWYGNSVAFWDNDVLITWTSNIQGWITHSVGEFSNAMQAIIIFTPIYNNDGAQTGLNREVIFYDPVALVSPVRVAHNLVGKTTFDNNALPYVFIECNPSIYPIEGRAQQIPGGTTFEMMAPSWFNRPWAQQWAFHETEMRTDLFPQPELGSLF